MKFIDIFRSSNALLKNPIPNVQRTKIIWKTLETLARNGKQITVTKAWKADYDDDEIMFRGALNKSSVGIATDCRLDDRGSNAGRGWEFFSSTTCPDQLWGPASLLSKGYRGAISLGVERPGREADHSLSSSAEVKECVELYLHSPIRFHVMLLR
jgi:hypothetical protein